LTALNERLDKLSEQIAQSQTVVPVDKKPAAPADPPAPAAPPEPPKDWLTEFQENQEKKIVTEASKTATQQAMAASRHVATIAGDLKAMVAAGEITDEQAKAVEEMVYQMPADQLGGVIEAKQHMIVANSLAYENMKQNGGQPKPVPLATPTGTAPAPVQSETAQRQAAFLQNFIPKDKQAGPSVKALMEAAKSGKLVKTNEEI